MGSGPQNNETAFKRPKIEVDDNGVRDLSSLERESLDHYTDINPSSSSQLNLQCYQRLEFIGDAVIDVIITEFLFEWTPLMTPGSITEWRSLVVSNEVLGVIGE